MPTIQEYRDELAERFPGCSVSVDVQTWRHRHKRLGLPDTATTEWQIWVVDANGERLANAFGVTYEAALADMERQIHGGADVPVEAGEEVAPAPWAARCLACGHHTFITHPDHAPTSAMACERCGQLAAALARKDKPPGQPYGAGMTYDLMDGSETEL